MTAEDEYPVAYQGVPAAFGEEAAIALVGDTSRALACRRFDDVFVAVSTGRARYGVVPIENSLVGSVHETYDALGRHALDVVDETILRVTHALIAPPGVVFEAVRRVHSHPVALGQCEELFRANPSLEAVAAFNTAGAVQEVIARGASDEAAIASPRAAQVYGGVVLRHAIEDDARNFTRFLLVARPGTKTKEARATPIKTSLVFELRHRPGALAEALGIFAAHGVDLTKIESRPIVGRPFEYAFYVDVRGAADRAPLSQALAALQTSVASLRALGSYHEFGDVRRALTE